MFNIKTPTSSYVLCFTSTPINHKVFFLFFFFFLQNTSCVRKPQVISVIFSEYLAYERLHRPETWRRFLYIYLLSFSSFWTLCIAWSVVISILECVTKWKPATECRMCIVTQESKGLRSWSCVEMCIIFKEGWKLLAVKQVPHPSATFSLTSYPKPSKNQIIHLHPNHSFLCCNGQGTS